MIGCKAIFILLCTMSCAVVSEELIDPTVATNKATEIGTVVNETDQMKLVASDDTKVMEEINGVVDLEDPTRISDSFQSALKRLTPKDKSGGATVISVVPEIQLAAIIDGYGKKRTALLKLKDKTQMVRKGQSFSLIKGNVVYEVYVDDIDLCEIKLNVSPPNQLIILR